MEHEKIVNWLVHNNVNEDMLDPIIIETAERWLRIQGVFQTQEAAKDIALTKNVWGLDAQVSYLTNFHGAEILVYEMLKKELDLPDISEQG